MGQAEKPNSFRVQVLDRAFAVLDLLAESPAEVTGAEVSVMLGLRKSTTHRLIAVFERHDVIERDSPGRYRLRWKLIHFGTAAAARRNIADLALPGLKRLSEECGETAHLGILRAGRVTPAANVEGTRALRTPAMVDHQSPAHSNSQGKVMLADLTFQELREFVRSYGLRRYMPNTITREQLRAELRRVCERGHAIDDEEFEEGQSCIGPPVRDPSGRVVAAISAAGPVSNQRQADGSPDRLRCRVDGRLSAALWYAGAAKQEQRRRKRGQMERRTFVATAAGAAASHVLARPASAGNRTIAIQFGAVSLADEGIEQVLDVFQNRARVNMLMPAVFSFSNGTAGRQLPGQPFPDHGNQQDEPKLRGGNFARVHPQYYRDTGIDVRLTQAPDHPDLDLIGDLLPPARKRGMKVVGLIQDDFAEDFPGLERFREVDFNGQRAETLCKNNPYYRNFLAGLVEDFTRSYEIDGLMFVCEQQGAFSNMLGSRLRGKARGLPGSRACFCEFCREKARKQGIRFDRVVSGFRELEKFAAAGRSRKRPTDGYYVNLWRLMLRYPELLVWEHFYHESNREVYRLMREQVKSVRASAMFGIHVWHNTTMSPIYAAEQDVTELARCADFLKIAVYNNCGGPRIASYIESVAETIYGDISPAELLQFHYRVFGYREAAYEEVRKRGLGPDYVYRESKRAVQARADRKVPILTGIDVGIPIRGEDLGGQKGTSVVLTTREGVKAATEAAFRAGVDGIVISRKYSEMHLDHLSGVGDAVREAGINS